MSKPDFERLRREILEADEALTVALERCGAARRALVSARRDDPDGYHPMPREGDVMALAERVTASGLPRATVRAILHEIAAAGAVIESPVTVSFLGPDGSLSHSCARRLFGAAAMLHPAQTAAHVFDAVSKSAASVGVVPLWSSVEGSYGPTLDALATDHPRLVAEATLPASYHLMSKTANPKDVEKIYAPAWILAACERFLHERYERTPLVDVRSAALAGQLAAEDHGAAALATDLVAELYALEVFERAIEDRPVEIRFGIISLDPSPRTGSDRTAVVFACSEEPGSLHQALRPFAEHRINLARIESRPAREAPWPVQFFVEMDGHMTDRPIVTALEQVKRTTRFLKILGSFSAR
ncbi:MAG: ACT domain-containing protein [Deltaproteobacteria bacterium]|nr:ACT domain-containing protein [Deltaproteobacteria bacterium]